MDEESAYLRNDLLATFATFLVVKLILLKFEHLQAGRISGRIVEREAKIFSRRNLRGQSLP